ncbi:Domain of unknown function DUF4422 [uncultured Caudovirales phage]|uniref:DUF4422 domain-containing protein n=1 Tax=uncultured Caudovirales phage TaxID=2100421 RepID=A0A6J5LKC1_9CAUD|nr:Domain of unknown function DUF4422 [uncultured Caudovirales phage]
MNRLTTYCGCYDNNYPKWNQQIFNQKNVMLGASALDEQRKTDLVMNGYILDDTLDNISHLNYTFGDLTNSYWVWKNAKEEWVGLTQYRRFWLEHQVAKISWDPNTIYIAQPQIWQSLMSQFIENHGVYAIQKLFESAMRPESKLKHDHVNMLNNIYTMYPYNMLFAHKDLYDKVCEVQFEILFDVFERSKEHIEQLDDYQRRMIAFLSERLLPILYINKKYFFGNQVNTEVVEMIWV